MDRDICIYLRTYGCSMPYPCNHQNDNMMCKLNGKIKTFLIYIPKHIRKPDTVVFKNKYTLDGVVYS